MLLLQFLTGFTQQIDSRLVDKVTKCHLTLQSVSCTLACIYLSEVPQMCGVVIFMVLVGKEGID